MKNLIIAIVAAVSVSACLYSVESHAGIRTMKTVDSVKAHDGIKVMGIKTMKTAE